MTQSSVAISVDGQDWVVLNASPDIRAQVQQSGLHPQTLRGSPIKAVVLTNGDIDHIAGLLTLRESTPFTIYATAAAMEILTQPVFRVLNPELVQKQQIALDTTFAPLPDLNITAFAVPGKVALFLEEGEPDTALVGEQTVGLKIQAGGKVLYYIPGCALVPDDLLERLTDADLLLFDGTVWENDEMKRTGTGIKTGARMGHIAMAGADGSIARLAGLRDTRRIFIHVNNTNPVLQPASREYAIMQEAGWALAQDGMEITI